jgi:hypothetical protein
MGTFWNNDHVLTPLAKKLAGIMPVSGPVEGKGNKKLERFRKLSNAYYRLKNDGDRSAYFRQLTDAQIEEKVAEACAEAYAEQFYAKTEIVS